MLNTHTAAKTTPRSRLTMTALLIAGMSYHNTGVANTTSISFDAPWKARINIIPKQELVPHMDSGRLEGGATLWVTLPAGCSYQSLGDMYVVTDRGDVISRNVNSAHDGNHGAYYGFAATPHNRNVVAFVGTMSGEWPEIVCSTHHDNTITATYEGRLLNGSRDQRSFSLKGLLDQPSTTSASIETHVELEPIRAGEEKKGTLALNFDTARAKVVAGGLTDLATGWWRVGRDEIVDVQIVSIGTDKNGQAILGPNPEIRYKGKTPGTFHGTFTVTILPP